METIKNPKQVNEEEEEEEDEDYVPPVRSNRYVYKYHRVGTGSLEQVAQSASSTPTSGQQEIKTTLVSHSASHSSSSSKRTETHTRVTSSNEYNESVITGAKHSHSVAVNQGQTHEGSKPTDVSAIDGVISQETGEKKGLGGTPVSDHDVTAESSLITIDQTLLQNASQPEAPISQGTSLSTTNVHQERLIETSTASESTHQGTEEHSPLEPHRVIVSGLTDSGVEIISGIESSPSEPHRVIVSGLTDSGVEIISGIECCPSESDKVTVAICGMTKADSKIIEGVDISCQSPQETPKVGETPLDAPQGLSSEPAHQAPLPSSTVVYGVTDHGATIVSGIASEVCTGSTNIVSGITEAGMEILSGLAVSQPSGQLGTLQSLQADAIEVINEVSKVAPKVGEEATPPLAHSAMIVAGVTESGEGIVFGMTSSQHIPQTTTEPPSSTSIVFGVTESGAPILATDSTSVCASLQLLPSMAVLPVTPQNKRTRKRTATTSESHSTEVIVCGWTNNNEPIVAGLSSATNKCTHSETPTTAVIAGLTADGVQIIGGLGLSEHSNLISSPSEPAIKAVISGLTHDGVTIVSGLSLAHGQKTVSKEVCEEPSPHCVEVTAHCNVIVEKPDESYHAQEPVAETQQSDPAVGVTPDDAKGSPSPFNLPPTDVPMRGDSV